MIKIFAKHHTDEKVLIVCSQEQVGHCMEMLDTKFGGNWVLVDKLNSKDEFLKFTDGLPYKGFHGNPERYVKGIEQII